MNGCSRQGLALFAAVTGARSRAPGAGTRVTGAATVTGTLARQRALPRAGRAGPLRRGPRHPGPDQYRDCARESSCQRQHCSQLYDRRLLSESGGRGPAGSGDAGPVARKLSRRAPQQRHFSTCARTTGRAPASSSRAANAFEAPGPADCDLVRSTFTRTRTKPGPAISRCVASARFRRKGIRDAARARWCLR